MDKMKPNISEHELNLLHNEGFEFMGNDDSEDAHAPAVVWGHGGWRPGAGYGPGRPPLPDGERRVKTSVTISPDNMAWLNEQKPASRSEIINQLIDAARAG